MKKKGKEITAWVVIIIIFAFFSLMYVKIIPSVLVSKTISAINSDDVSAFRKYSDMLDYFPYSTTWEVSLYLQEQETDVANEINEKFQNFESTSEIEKYVKDNYPLLYRCCVKDDIGGTIIKDRIDSKQTCIEYKEQMEELSQCVENSKSLLAQYSQLDGRERWLADGEIYMTFQKRFLFDIFCELAYDKVQGDLTYINKIKPIEDELRTDLEKIEQEKDELNEYQ
ncbi:MAG: hypothetical protein ACI4IG_06015 [Eubacterium sp.]